MLSVRLFVMNLVNFILHLQILFLQLETMFGNAISIFIGCLRVSIFGFDICMLQVYFFSDHIEKEKNQSTEIRFILDDSSMGN